MAGKWRRDDAARERDRIKAQERRAENMRRFGRTTPGRIYVNSQYVNTRTYDPEDYSHPLSDVRLGP